MSTGGLLAAGFVNPALLGGLALIALPIIIHWLSRRRFRHKPWAAMRFLLEAERETRRRVRLEQWLLLALRCLAMLLLALLVTRPFLEAGTLGALLGRGGRVQRVLVLGDSASLQYRVGASTQFAELRTAAERLLTWVAQEDAGAPIAVYRTSQPTGPWWETAELTAATLGQVREPLRALTPTDQRADPRRVLATVVARVATLGALDRLDVFVFSDFQRTDWIGAADAPAVFEPLREQPAEKLRVVMVTTDSTPRPNVALRLAALERPHAVALLPATLRTEVIAHGGDVPAELGVTLDVAGQSLPSVALDPAGPDGARKAQRELTLPNAGFLTLKAVLSRQDALAIDDEFRLAVHVREALRVLLVNGRPAVDPRRDEVFLLRRALSPPGPFSSGMLTDVADPEGLEGTDLNVYDTVLLCNVPQLSEGAVAALERFVRGGGGLGVFLGDNAEDVSAYNQMFYAQGRGLLPAELLGVADAGAPGAGLVATGTHPVTTMFPTQGGGLSEYVHFRRFVRCRVPTAPAGGNLPTDPNAANDPNALARAAAPRVLARFTDAEQSPALIERTLGRGRVLLCTSSVDLDWDDWAAAPDGSYVVTMLETVQYLARPEDAPGAYVVGQPLTLPLPLERYEPAVVFKSPAFPQEPAVTATADATGAASGEPAVVHGPVATRVGTYTVELTPRVGPVETRPLCVNLDPRESDLRSAPQAELDGALGGVPHTYVEAAAGFGDQSGLTKRELWPTVLGVLLALLMAEQALAWWFGRLDRGGLARDAAKSAAAR